MRFILKAIGPDGRVERSELQAPDRENAARQLESRGYAVLSVQPLGFSLLHRATAGARFPVLLMSQQLLVLLRAGLSLVESVELLAQKEKRDDARLVLERIALMLREGRPLSVALEQFPQAFSALFAATVRASERTGDLPQALSRYIAYSTQLEAIKRRVVNASIYPALLLGVGGLVSLFLLFYVVPRFGRIYAERGVDLPLMSRLLLAWGEAVHTHGAVILGILALVVAGAVLALRTPRWRGVLVDWLWRVPALGERMKLYQLSRFYRTTGMLLHGGTTLVTALRMSADLLHPVLRKRLAEAGRAISEGRPVSQSMEAAGLATPVALRMLAVGEKSGNMAEMLGHIADYHDEDLGRWIEWFTRLFEPLLMAAIGLVIGAVVILMYLPIFELAGNLQ
jgi:general secretion pathway protein F